MITLELYPLEHEPKRIGTIHHSSHGVAASIAYEYKSKLPIRRYLCGLEPPNYPVPATMLQSAVANFHNREWSWKWAIEWTKARIKL